MSAHLQFGPEWMRKGPGKINAGGATQQGSNSNENPASAPEHPSTPLSPSGPAASKAAKGSSRRNPSLSNLSGSNNAMLGPTSVTPSATTPLAGGFSFAAAAQGGASKDSAPATSTSTSIPLSSDGDSARYSMRLLSLYSSERGGKNAAAATASNVNETAPPTSPSATQKKKTMANSGSGGSLSERESRRTTSIGHDFFSPPRPHSPTNEARGLNARSSLDKITRPGLFQRGSASTSSPAASAPVLSPTQLFHSKERDRHGAGIQGGVLAGVVAPPSSRRRKESELGLDSLRTPRDVEYHNQSEQHHQQQQSPTSKRQNDAFTSARNRNTRTTTNSDVVMSKDGAAFGTLTNTPLNQGNNANSSSGIINREPIGPTPDHSGGFAKFAGYEKKRERQASNMNSHRYPSDTFQGGNGSGIRRGNREVSLERQNQSSGDVDMSKHATSVLDSLKLDADEDDQRYAARTQRQDSNTLQRQASQQMITDWSPSKQEWYYKDPSGQIQGPFNAEVMQSWHQEKYFSPDLLVRRAEDEEYQSLNDMMLYIGNSQIPFLISPTEYVGMKRINRFPSFERSSAGRQSPFMQHQSSQQSLGWPNNHLDNPAYRSGATAGGSSNGSPFATPQLPIAELENNPQMRAQYAEMIRQREMAEYRAKQEQQAAQMAAIAMAQAQGRDPSSLGLWPPNNAMDGSWGGQQQQLSGYGNNGELNLWQQQLQQQHQQQTQNQYDQQAHFQQQQPSHLPDPQHAQQQAAANQGEHQSIQQDDTNVVDTSILQASANRGENDVQQASTEEARIVEGGDAAGVTEEKSQELPAGVEGGVPKEDEQSPEEAWPQSPSAVEFASEPLMTEDQWARDESPSRNKRGKRGAHKPRSGKEEEFNLDRSAKQQSFSSGNVKTMSEEQFRSTQKASRDASTTSPQTTLANWLPDASTPNSASATKAAPWANTQQDSNTSGMSLREIQEAEARKAEARKANKPRLQLHTSPSSNESTLPTTMTWGLAGSHAANGPRETSSASPPALAWNAKQAPRKTLMEIQEEERARAKKAKDAQAASNTARGKAYADLAGRVQAGIPSNQSGGSWNIVGAGGKAAPPAIASLPSRPSKIVTSSPPVQRIASNGLPSTLANGPTSRVASNRVSISKNSSDGSPAPSPEFIKHCKEQLKGLNVKVDDFIEMLLSFPLDPSPDVIEIIAESVYASSSTLDGRRFASDFVAKRKLDAGQGKGGLKSGVLSSSLTNGPSNATIAPRTASDILKSTPASAAANDGFGGFKVVKPKGAKKRT